MKRAIKNLKAAKMMVLGLIEGKKDPAYVVYDQLRDFMRRLDMGGKKKEVETGRRICIPEEYREKVAELVMEYKYKGEPGRLWKFIGEIMPETRNGQWSLHTGCATRYFVEEHFLGGLYG
jgi:hypothetical protein